MTPNVNAKITLTSVYANEETKNEDYTGQLDKNDDLTKIREGLKRLLGFVPTENQIQVFDSNGINLTASLKTKKISDVIDPSKNLVIEVTKNIMGMNYARGPMGDDKEGPRGKGIRYDSFGNILID